MEKDIQIKPIGTVIADKNSLYIQLESHYRQALTNIEGFSHLIVVWWGHLMDTPEFRSITVNEKPYKKGPDKIGIFATRSPIRPNPILLTTIIVSGIDTKSGIINTPWIDAEPNSPVLDIKPYHMEERVKEPQVPAWCRHWPQWYEDSATFNWAEEFNF